MKYATLARTKGYPTFQLYFLGLHTRQIKAHVCTIKKRVTRGIFHGMPRENIAQLFYIFANSLWRYLSLCTHI